MKIRLENSNILADFDKMDNLRVKKSKKTKFQKLLNKIFKLPQYLPPKTKFAFLNVQIPKKNSNFECKNCHFSKSMNFSIFLKQYGLYKNAHERKVMIMEKNMTSIWIEECQDYHSWYPQSAIGVRQSVFKYLIRFF